MSSMSIDAVRAATAPRAAPDAEQSFFDHLDGLISDTAARPAQGWKPGRALQVLLAGYVGAGNVGADMRTVEAIRQLRHLLGTNVAFSTILSGPHAPPNPVSQAKLLSLGGFIPRSVVDFALSHDAVVACEGSMLKSSFSNVLSGIMAGALGAGATSGRLSVGYGAEVASMEPVLESFVRKWLPGSLFLCRNAESTAAATGLGLRAVLGADTAWTCQAASPEQARSRLGALGYDSARPVLAVCPVNPFWWPVRPNRQLAGAAGKGDSAGVPRYGGTFFHTYDDARASKYAAYIEGLARAVNVVAKEQKSSPLIVAMEPIDAAACEDLNVRLDRPAQIVSGHTHPIGVVVALLREADLLISSRFHALVAAAPAGNPLIGVATDERIANLLTSCGAGGALVGADAADLADRIIATARTIDREQFADALRRLVRTQVVQCGEMAIEFTNEVRRCIPEFPLPERGRGWEAHLPPLPRPIQDILKR